MKKYIVAGGTGFIGQHKVAQLIAQGNHVVILTTRNLKFQEEKSNPQLVYWDPSKRFIDPVLQCNDCYVINLAGASIAGKRWTASRKKELLLSRLNSLETLRQAIVSKQIRVQHLTSVSAIGYYGEHDQLFNEIDAGDSSFLSAICQQWEAMAFTFRSFNIPVAIARMGIVLGREGGAFPALKQSFLFHLAVVPGTGQQIYSWLHITDAARLLCFLSTEKKDGIYNAVAPFPVSMGEIITEMQRNEKRLSIRLRIHAWLIHLTLGEMGIELLKSCDVSSRKITNEGFKFLYPKINEAVKQLYQGD